MKFRGFLVMMAFGEILPVSARIHLQVSGATFTGSVGDSSGAVIPDAKNIHKEVAEALPTVRNEDSH